MRYVSTRGQAPELTFEEAMLTGLARDGGLYVPAEVPDGARRHRGAAGLPTRRWRSASCAPSSARPSPMTSSPT
jgi:threonine synthase